MLRLTRQVTSDDGVELTLEGSLNPSFASRLLPGGYAYEFDEGGTVKLTLKLKAAAEPIVVNHFTVDEVSPYPKRHKPIDWAGLTRHDKQETPYVIQRLQGQETIDAVESGRSNEQKETLDEQLAKEKQEEV